LSDLGKISFLKGSARYKGSTEQSIGLQVPLVNTMKELEEFDRNINVDLAELYDAERQRSPYIYPMAKFSIIFENAYSGTTPTNSNPYPPFNNNLYYINENYYKQLQIQSNGSVIPWGGFPQYNEFDFIRTDYDVTGYTLNSQTDPPHYVPMAKDTAKLNWSFYISYPFSSTTSQTMYYTSDAGNAFLFTAGDGIPFIMFKTSYNGKSVWQFKCQIPHGLKNGESVITSVQSNSINVFDVYSFGDGTQDSEMYIFNIYDIGFTNFTDTLVGTFKRVVNKEYLIESTSRYYVRLHKIIDTPNNANLTYAGFENNAFRTVKKFISPQLSPNFVSRVATKEGSDSYNLSFTDNVDITGLYDNLNRPITELYFTVVNRGRFGWFNKPTGNPLNIALKHGWSFNLGPQLNTWWDNGNPNSLTNVTTTPFTNSYQGRTFYYNNEYNVGDIIKGDFCEFNDFTQEERVISEYYHKFTFNSDNFVIGGGTPNNQLGYYYKPHYKFQLKVFSPYIEESDGQVIAGLPNYAYYKNATQEFIWRDIYPFGFIDENGNGVDYPFMNNKHYPYNNFTFRIIPEGTNIISAPSISDPLIDDCE
jgi:hypothetical protein